MELNVLERIMLMGILPQQGNYVTHKIIADLKSELSFSEREMKMYDMKDMPGKDGKPGQVIWQKSGDKEIAIGEKASEIICTALRKLDKDGKINDQNNSVYEKFMIKTE